MFNKGLDKDDKKEGVLKRLKDIEGKNEEQLTAIKDQGKRQLRLVEDHGKRQLDEIKNNRTDSRLKKISLLSELNQAAKEPLKELIKENNDIDTKKRICVKTDETLYSFNIFKHSLEFASNIYSGKISLKEAENKTIQNACNNEKTKNLHSKKSLPPPKKKKQL